MSDYNIFNIVDNTDLNKLRFLACLSCGITYRRKRKSIFCEKCYSKSIRGKKIHNLAQRRNYWKDPEKHRNYTRKYRSSLKYAIRQAAKKLRLEEVKNDK